MTSQDFITLVRQEPFHPFRIAMNDGRKYDVVHPELLGVGQHGLTIGFPRKGSNKPFFESLEMVTISDITGVEILEDSFALKTD